jgi:GxxExxY protein
MDEIDKITEAVIGAAFAVSNTLGAGFLEKVYENALVHELEKANLSVKQQAPVKVFYDDVVVGEYFADILVEEKVIVELKTVKAIDNAHMAQSLNYLKATGLKICLLINFGLPKVQIKRIIN